MMRNIGCSTKRNIGHLKLPFKLAHEGSLSKYFEISVLRRMTPIHIIKLGARLYQRHLGTSKNSPLTSALGVQSNDKFILSKIESH